jgi:ATP-dependent Lon protease
MNNPNAIEVLVRTESLKKILDEEPEVKLKLQSMAVEKIAEELLRKAKHTSITQFQTQMENTINKAMAEVNRNLVLKYRFPEEAKAIIREFAKESVEAYWKAELNRFEKVASDFFTAKQAESDKQTEIKVLETIEKMRPIIRAQAREEFISVLEAAREVAR